MSSIVSARVVPPSQRNAAVPRAFDAVILRAMHRDPARRYPSVHALGSALLAFASRDAWTLWSTEFASEAQVESVASGETDVRAVSSPTHATEMIADTTSVQPWHRRLLLGAITFALVAVTTGTVLGRANRTATSLVSAGGAQTKAQPAKMVDDGRRDTLGNGPVLETVATAAPTAAPPPRPRPVVTTTAPLRVPSSAVAPTAATPMPIAAGANGAPILE
jgi:serine/threonine-protein kinase